MVKHKSELYASFPKDKFNDEEKGFIDDLFTPINDPKKITPILNCKLVLNAFIELQSILNKTYKSLDSKDITFEELKVFELLCNDLIENNEKLKTCLCPEAYSVVLPKDETENIYPTPEEKEKQLESQVKKLIDILENIEKNLKCCYNFLREDELLELKAEKNIGSGVEESKSGDTGNIRFGVEETKSDDTEKIGVSILFEPIEHLIEMIKSVCEND